MAPTEGDAAGESRAVCTRPGSRVRRLLLLLASVAVIARSVAGSASTDIAVAAGKTAKVDPALKQGAASDPRAVVPVIIERSSENTALDALTASGGKAGRTLKLGKALTADVRAGAVDALALESGVLRVAFDAPLVGQAEVDWDARPLATIYPAVVGAPDVWSAGLRGTGVGVAILDSGLRDHEDYKAADKNGRRGGRSRLVKKVAVALDDPGGADDDYGHGTRVAGIVGGAAGATGTTRTSGATSTPASRRAST